MEEGGILILAYGDVCQISYIQSYKKANLDQVTIVVVICYSSNTKLILLASIYFFYVKKSQKEGI